MTPPRSNTITRAPRRGSKGAAKPVPGRRPRAPKADGDRPVQAYVAKLTGWKQEVARRFDSLVGREVPNVRRAIKWSSPMYGIEGQGWFAAVGVFSKHVKLTFFRGARLKPVPPSGTSREMRSIDLKEVDEFDERRLSHWIRQAAKIPGWGAS